MTIPEQYDEIKSAFQQAAILAGVKIPLSEIEVQFSAAPHIRPTSLPTGKLAVYVFMFGDRCLKVGKAGPKSAARFCSHHYGASRAPSTLAKSLVNNVGAVGDSILDDSNVGDWIGPAHSKSKLPDSLKVWSVCAVTFRSVRAVSLES